MRDRVRLTRDRLGTPALWADDMLGAMWGQGAIHAHLRPLQTLLAHTAAQGQLRRAIGPLPALTRLDALARRLDICALAQRAYLQLDDEVRAWLGAYVAGFTSTLATRGAPGLARTLRMKLPALEPQGVLRLLLLTSYLGQGEGQSRMELSLVALARQGARPEMLEALFGSLLNRSALLRAQAALPPQSPLKTLAQLHREAPSLPLGSNAWAVHGSRSLSGQPLLAGDPHLAIHELPAVLCELRAQIGDTYWLGASIPGLPGLFVGRNRFVAFSGTFAFADTVDWAVCADATHDAAPPTLREHWPGARGLAQSLAGYLRLALARDAQEALRHIAETETLSLTFVVADRFGEVHKQQAGAALVRPWGHSGLTPYEGPGAPCERDARASLPAQRASVVEPLVLSANDGDVPDDLVGLPGWTLPQPAYRRQRIAQLLARETLHTPHTLAAMQLDVLCLQGTALRTSLVQNMRPSATRRALVAWDGRMDVGSVGAHAFTLAYTQALRGLAPHLGAAAWLELLAHTELPLWWARALDGLLARALSSASNKSHALFSDVRATLDGALSACEFMQPEAWGNVHRIEQRHILLGQLGGAGRRSQPWAGSLSTVQQGSQLTTPHGTLAIGAAYRFVTDVGSDEILSTLPGGQDERPWHASYGCFIGEYHAGGLHRLTPPSPDEELWP